MLQVVATPIGQFKDLSPRAIEVIRNCDFLICEELRESKTLLKKIGTDKECLPLNEHNEGQIESEYLPLIRKGNVALISDCGTPGIADPGSLLIRLLHTTKIPVSPVPGPCSITSALSVCGFDLIRYFFAGFPPRNKDERVSALKNWDRIAVPIVILETPFRLNQLLEAAVKAFGRNRSVCLCVNLTSENECIFWGTLKEIQERIGKTPKKHPFVLIVDSCSRN